MVTHADSLRQDERIYPFNKLASGQEMPSLCNIPFTCTEISCHLFNSNMTMLHYSAATNAFKPWK